MAEKKRNQQFYVAKKAGLPVFNKKSRLEFFNIKPGA